ncbi:hypothetical protein D9M68_795320 [compost metagenome]
MAECSKPLNADQLCMVLQTIASRAEVARQAIWRAVNDEGVALVAAAEAVATIITSISAIADSASGSTVIGNADRWNFGPNFADAGEEVQHG